MSKFFKKGEVVLLNGGYVSAKATKKPINNAEFIAAQREAEFLVTLAANMAGKNFSALVVDSISDLVAETRAQLSATVTTEFVSAPAAPKATLTDKLRKEALAFTAHAKEAEEAEFVNSKLQAFNVINEFENHGLFFKSDVTKLNRIYTMDEVVAAAKTVYAVLKD